MKYSLKILLSILILNSSVGCKKNVDLIIYNANIYTVDNTFSFAEAIAIKDGIFYDVGENDILNKGNLFKTLLLMGVKGIGLYDTFIHFDFRKESGNQNFNEFNYSFWDNRIKKKDYEIINLIKGENKRYINIPILVLSLIYLIKKILK